jgi:uncharacterized membrane protein HdeD (DUF308 family)
MANNVEMTTGNKAAWTVGGRRMRGVLVLVMGCLAMTAPLFAASLAVSLVGLLLIVCGVLEMLETFRFPDESSQRSAYVSGAVSILIGVLLLNSPKLILGGLVLLFAGSFLIDGISKTVTAWKARVAGTSWRWALFTAVVNVGLSLVLLTRWPVSGLPIIAVLVGIRMLVAGWAMVFGREATVPELPADGLHPDRRLKLPPHPEFIRLESSLKTEEEGRRSIDAYWCWTFVVLFFAIHIGRMNLDWHLVALIAPLFAVLGDVVTALVIAFGLILPWRMAWRKVTRPLERKGWKRMLARIDQGQGPGLTDKLYQPWLTHRLRFARCLAQIRHSPRSALRWGMQVGLPATAILIAVNPIWGFNWFFNSEAWTTEIWDRWAEARTDTWRENMIEAVHLKYRDNMIPIDRLALVEPAGVAGSDDFSFLVLGDTGEGGSAQQSLRDQYLFLGKSPEVKFLVISSDVIYPAGAMRDYEPKFYLPFKGFTKPIYAIPGNHDWYDALEGFAANFLEEDAARASMLSRVETDGRLTTTTEGRINRYIKEAARLRKEFGVSTGWQRGPFFEVQTDRFALIAVDTGVLKSVDSRQWDWLKAALARANGKAIMVILGHPLYAGGRYQGGDDIPIAGEWTGGDHQTEPFLVLHRLLREHQVDIVMAGDTHYFEHYLEQYETRSGTRTMRHFVNGGGGAYISIGTPLDWPNQPAVPDCTFFPRTAAVVAKLDRDTPTWKMPLWLWAKHFRAWPATAETIAAAFDYSRAPFFQSFVEVRVEGSANRIRLIPRGGNGPLRWQEMQTFGAVVPAGKTDSDFVEFIIEMPPRRP